MKRIPIDIREQQIKNICKSEDSVFIGWSDTYKNNKSPMIIHCGKHGDYTTNSNLFVDNGVRCPKCKAQKIARLKRHDITELNYRIESLCIKDNLKYEIEGEYKNIRTLMKIYCKNNHTHSLTIKDFLAGNRCAKCKALKNGNRLRTPIEVVNNKINNVCEKEGYQFIGWHEKYLNQKNKITLNCTKHGQWHVSCFAFLNYGHRCPGCCSKGFNNSMVGFLYVLRSSCGTKLKIGISNKPKQRIKILKRETPFEFQCIEMIKADGHTIQSLEKDFHSHFESAGLTGFDGCTEWLKWNPNITTLIRML